MGLPSERSPRQLTLQEKVTANGFALAYHNALKNGEFIAPDGTRFIPLGQPEPLEPTLQMFVFDPRQMEVVTSDLFDDVRYFYALVGQGWSMIGGPDARVAYKRIAQQP